MSTAPNQFFIKIGLKKKSGPYNTSWPMEFQFTVISLSDIYADVALVLVSLLSTIFQCKDLNVSKTKKKRTKIIFFLRTLIRIQCEEKILLNGLHDICSLGSLPFFMPFYQVLTPLIMVSLQCALSSDRFSQLVYKL